MRHKAFRVALALALATTAAIGLAPTAATATPTSSTPAPSYSPRQAATPPPLRRAAGTPVDRSQIYIVGDSTMATGLVAGSDRMGVRLGYRLCGEACGQPGQPTIHNVAQGGQLLDGGTAVISLTAQWPSILAATPKPTLIIIGIGMNDLWANESDASFTSAYTSIVSSARAAGIAVLVCEIPPIGSTHWPVELLRQHWNQWLDDWYGASVVVPLGQLLRSASASWLDSAYDYGDGVHENAYGVLRMTDGEAAKVDTLMLVA